MAGTDDELQFGDSIEFDVVKETENGHGKHKHLECEFTEDLIPLLLTEGVIEERETDEGDENPKNIVDFGSPDEKSKKDCLNGLDDEDDDELVEAVDILAENVETLTKLAYGLQDRVKVLQEQVDYLSEKPSHKDFVTTEDYIKSNWDIFKPLHNWVYEKPFSYNPNVEIFGFAL